jgi:hypothetical protein
MTLVDEWYVGFGEFEPPRSWFHWFTTPGWRHVFCFGASGSAWIVYDPLSKRAEMAAVTGEYLDHCIAAWKAKGCKFLRVKTQRIHLFQRLVPLYCVTCVKHVLGVRGFAVTPRQLYQLLLSQGAEPAFGTEVHDA